MGEATEVRVLRDLDGYRVVVTGGGSGIGLSAARLLAARGARLALVGRRRGVLEAALGSLVGDGHAVIDGDIGDAGFARSLAGDAADAMGGGLSCVINNAGYAPLEPLGEGDPATVERCFRVNAVGPALLIESAVGLLRSGGVSGVGPGPCVVNVSTMGTADPFPGFFAYASSKAALNSMTRSIVNECAEPGVRAFTIAPGAVETGMLRGLFDESAVPASAALAAEDVGALIVACIAGERDAENGRTLFITRGEDGGVRVRASSAADV